MRLSSNVYGVLVRVSFGGGPYYSLTVVVTSILTGGPAVVFFAAGLD